MGAERYTCDVQADAFDGWVCGESLFPQLFGGTKETLLFRRVDAFEGGLKRGGPAMPHFDDGDEGAFLGDNIEFEVSESKISVENG